MTKTELIDAIADELDMESPQASTSRANHQVNGAPGHWGDQGELSCLYRPRPYAKEMVGREDSMSEKKVIRKGKRVDIVKASPYNPVYKSGFIIGGHQITRFTRLATW